MVIGCNKEFKAKQLLAKHCTVAHGYQLRAGSPKPLLRNRSSFYLLTTPLTQASRFVCKCLSRQTLKKYARKTSKQIDFAEVNRECKLILAFALHPSYCANAIATEPNFHSFEKGKKRRGT
jgi:metastasis-associated protein MTA